MYPAYRYGILKPHRTVDAAKHNASWLGPTTLGIEVTEPELAVSCGLGNIDPQHLGGSRDTSAIDATQTWPLPPPGAALVTIRPDVDSVGAMALLTLRANDVPLPAEARERIALVDRHDRFDFGSWPGPRPLPRCVEEINEVGSGPHHLGTMIGGLVRPGLPIDECVQRMAEWILNGSPPCAWIDQATRAAEALFTALKEGVVTLEGTIAGRIAVVRGFAPGALRLGYRLAPVVISVAHLQTQADATPMRKITIAQYSPGLVDLACIALEFSAIERGWGGSPLIIGSPQGVSSHISVEQCVNALIGSIPMLTGAAAAVE